MRVLRLMPLLLSLTLAAACGDDGPASHGPSGQPSGLLTVQLDERPFQLYVPASYSPDHPAPLVLLLHGYGSDGAGQASYFAVMPQADQRGFLYAIPDGTEDRGGRHFWNATDACCNFDGSDVDDSAYLSELIDTVRAAYSIGQVVVIGHSNGGFMTYRMACEHADQISAIASLAGVEWQDRARCAPSAPVSVLQIHGTADGQIGYGGGAVSGGGRYPGAEETVARWVDRDHCDTAATTGTTLDLDDLADGAETTVTGYSCPGGVRVELWRMQYSAHVPSLTDAFTPAVLDFLLAAPAR